MKNKFAKRLLASTLAFSMTLSCISLNRNIYAELLESAYDSRNINGYSYVNSVKDQKSTNTGWAFAATETFESCCLKQDGGIPLNVLSNNLSNNLSGVSTGALDISEDQTSGENNYLTLSGVST